MKERRTQYLSSLRGAKRRSNLNKIGCSFRDCFAALAMTTIFVFAMTLVFLSFFIFTGNAIAGGTNYFVRIDGNDSCDGKTNASVNALPNCAFLTVQQGVNSARNPGDVVNISGDHSSEGLINSVVSGCAGSGCASNPTYITIQITPGDPQYSAIINPGININNDYIIVKGLGITGSWAASSGYSGVSLNGGFNRIINNHFYNPRGPIASSAIMFYSSSHDNFVDSNLIEGDTNPLRVTGHNTGGVGTTLVDSYYTWAPNQFIGRAVWDLTGTSQSWAGTDAGTIVSNDAHSFVTSKNITWQPEDCYVIGTSYWIPIAINGQNNVISNNIVRNLADSERIFDGIGDNTIISGNNVYDLLDGAVLRDNVTGQVTVRPDFVDNCNAHTDLFQIWDEEAKNVTIEGNFFHDLESQTGILEGNGHTIDGWMIRNNVFANIAYRQTIGGTNFKWYNNTIFNVAQGDQLSPLEDWQTGEEYKNNIIIGGSTNPNYGMISASIGNWVDCAHDVITQTWTPNTPISNLAGQAAPIAYLTANGHVYQGAGSGSTGNSTPDWTQCPNVGNTCTDAGITWTNTAWNTWCNVTGTVDVEWKDNWFLSRKNNVTSSFTCGDTSVLPDPNIYDAPSVKDCYIMNIGNPPVSNNYYGIWNPPSYSPRNASLIDENIGDPNYVNGGDPKFVAAYNNCITNACDFRIQAGSPLIGKGVDLSSVFTTDKDGKSRPQGSAWDIGAYQAIGSASIPVYGDVSGNGPVTMYDAALALQLLNGITCSSLFLTQQDCNNAQMDEGSAIDSTDVIDIARKAMGL